MRYREIRRAGFSVSEIGLGGEYLEGKDYSLVKDVIDAALDNGINILDCFMPEPNVRSAFGKALKGRREKMFIEGHMRPIWEDHQYARTLDMKLVVKYFDDLLLRLDTDYIDIGLIHMIDNDSDYDAVFNGPIMEYALRLKERGVIRSLGISSHSPVHALRAARSGLVDVMLFSINPAYDVLSEKAQRPRTLGSGFFDSFDVIDGINEVRTELYNYCEANGIGITVMKTLAAGALLSDDTSPFGKALSVPQCIHYALSRPGVSSVLLGMQSRSQVEDAMKYEIMDEKDLDYSFIFSETPKFTMDGRCMYCNHCLPCPMHIDIAAISKYLDMALVAKKVFPTVKAHYDSLEHKASECIGCGACEKRCPFNVHVRERMRKAVDVFERQQ